MEDQELGIPEVSPMELKRFYMGRVGVIYKCPTGM